jgi:ATP-binding cassette subfamily C protein LapB
MRQIDPAELRATVALVPQESRLFLGTLRENLEIARTDRRGDDEQLVAALRQFSLTQMIARHPRGLDMQLGEDGMGLSGGQKRLVALARLALRDPTVALLDEPTSGLDPSTERTILNTLRQWADTPAASGARRSMVLVTHRPQVLEIVDRVLVLESGRIVVDGPRAEVMEKLAKGITISTDGKAA